MFIEVDFLHSIISLFCLATRALYFAYLLIDADPPKPTTSTDASTTSPAIELKTTSQTSASSTTQSDLDPALGPGGNRGERTLAAEAELPCETIKKERGREADLAF